ncbi:MAG: DUF4270 family protein [Bacteroidota bacterium]
MNKRVFGWLSFASVLLLLTAGSCTKSTPLGAELVDQDQNQITFTDTVSVTAITVAEDRVRTYSPDQSLQLTSYLLGQMNDPIFGLTTASFYAQMRYSIAGEPQFEDDATLDSIVLMLDYDTLSFYGEVETPWNIDVYELSETMDPDATYYSNDGFATKPTPLGSVNNFIPNFRDSINVIRLDDTTGFVPHLRIRLDDALGDFFLGIDSADYADENIFLDLFKGIQVQATSQTEGLLAFSLNTTATRMALYYSTDTLKKEYIFDITGGSAKSAEYAHNYGSNISLEDPTQGDSILFVQGMSGGLIQLDFPHIRNFQNLIVNKAELEFTVAVLPDDKPETFVPSRQLILVEQDSDGEFILTEDVERSVTQQNLLDTRAFGGNLRDTVDVDGIEIQQYRMNTAARLQDMIEGSLTTPLFIRSFTKPTNGSRVVIYGPGHSKYPMKLNLIFTNIN